MAQFTIQQAFDLAVRHQSEGRLNEAEQVYRQILALHPGHTAAMHNLGLIAHLDGRYELAVDLIRKAIALGPESAGSYFSLANVLVDAGQLDEAIAAYRKSISLNGNFPEANNNFGHALSVKGEFDDAITAYREAIALRPSFAEAYNNLGNALRDAGQLDEAIATCRKAISLKSNFPEAHINLGSHLIDKGQLDEAIAACRQGIALNPNFPKAHNILGNALRGKGQPNEAIASYRRAIAIRPNEAEAYSNLGNALRDKGRLDEAIAANKKAVTLNPDFPEAHNDLGNALRDAGQLDEAVNAYRQAVVLKPGYAEAHSNLVLLLHYHGGYGARAIAEELGRWNRQHAEPLQRFIQSHSNDRNPDRRLRIGYVSGDFGEHVVGRNHLALVRGHDRRPFEIFCYAQVACPDVITRQFEQCADGWRNTMGLSDDQVATQIRDDRIDILVDLALHTAKNRLLVFARKPAPVQVTFAGYPGSTGLRTIDYRLSDPYLDPPGIDETVYSERTVRLPDSFWFYDPLENKDIPVNSLPALETGVVIFGWLNTFCKVNDSTLALWAKVMRPVEGSGLLLLAPDDSPRLRTLDFFRREGIDSKRIEFVPRQSRRKYLELYHRIDVGLDSFPYNGHSTSLDSFWMGVPVITLVGQTAVSRAGWCQLSNLGLGELAGDTAEDFVRIAVELANNLPRLSELRSTLRRRMEQSPLMDAQRFTRNIEAEYRRMWRGWCETVSAKN
jgi:predicted O-linked N-acetylglucosamine transferase (SPINDLY family)